MLCFAEDDDGLLGHVAVDTFVDGGSHGGVRTRLDVTAEEVSLLASTMTMKCRFLGLPFGGGKTGILGDSEASQEERRSLLARFGRAVAPLLQKELFVPAADMGINLDDIRNMLREAGVKLQYGRTCGSLPEGALDRAMTDNIVLATFCSLDIHPDNSLPDYSRSIPKM